ncbi:kinase-like protein [Calocera viscosa TUFC12733]|uniref:Kinase-like protein n=1 Tax=Calocera viscosa (strain TUFC12733) TaxID=1330018 RepID=A0A167KVF8_CALVF|nr:kinase-like protein [Calocera viscosa TUFC12733]
MSQNKTTSDEVPPLQPPAAQSIHASSQSDAASVSSTAEDVNAPYGLTVAEKNWADIQPDLLQRGYRLRPRYQPGWVGSWVGTKKKPEKCEDSIGIRVSGITDGIVMDAVRMKDGTQVLLKLWNDEPRDAAELPVLRYFSDKTGSSDPTNHCVPLLDTFPVEGYSDIFDLILVEPLLRDCRQPPFLIATEALSFILQALEGLEYMHSLNVAHGDIHMGNILMDARALFPKGFHGAFNLSPGHRFSEKGVKRLTRLQVPVKYYYIDFGSSVMFPSFEERALVLFNAAVWIPPEVQANKDAPFDPFKADVFALGLTLLEELRFQYREGLGFLMPVLESMIADNPDERPTAREATVRFRTALASMSRRQMRKKLGWAKVVSLPVCDRVSQWTEYIKLLWHSYKYGLPKDVLDVGIVS